MSMEEVERPDNSFEVLGEAVAHPEYLREVLERGALDALAAAPKADEDHDVVLTIPYNGAPHVALDSDVAIERTEDGNWRAHFRDGLRDHKGEFVATSVVFGAGVLWAIARSIRLSKKR